MTASGNAQPTGTVKFVVKRVGGGAKYKKTVTYSGGTVKFKTPQAEEARAYKVKVKYKPTAGLGVHEVQGDQQVQGQAEEVAAPANPGPRIAAGGCWTRPSARSAKVRPHEPILGRGSRPVRRRRLMIAASVAGARWSCWGRCGSGGWPGRSTATSNDAAGRRRGVCRSSLTSGDEQASRTRWPACRSTATAPGITPSGVTWSLGDAMSPWSATTREVCAWPATCSPTSAGTASPRSSTRPPTCRRWLRGTEPFRWTTIEELQPRLSRARAAFDQADARLSREDSSGYVGRLQRKYRELAGRVVGREATRSTRRTPPPS